MLKYYPLLTDTKTWKNTHTHTHTHTHTLPVLICRTISQPCIIYRQNKLISLVCFITLLEYRKIFKNVLLLDETNKTSLSFLDRSIYDLMVEKLLPLWLNSKACGEHFTVWLSCTTVRTFSHILSFPYSPSEWFNMFLFSAVCEVLALLMWLDLVMKGAWRAHLTTLLDR